MVIGSGGTNRFNVAIGTTSFYNQADNRSTLSLGGGTSGSIITFGANSVDSGYIIHSGTDMYMVNQKNGPMMFYTNDTERMRITSGGNVLIGASTTSDSVSSRIYLRQSTDNDFKGLVLVSASAGEFAGSISMDSSGNLSFAHSYLNGAGSYQGIKFLTSGSERMRITSGGTAVFAGPITANCATGGNTALTIQNTSNNTAATAVAFLGWNASLTGSIQTYVNVTTYNTSSDYRLKEDLKEFSGLDLVTKLKMYDFKWKEADSRMYGGLAHEIQEVVPYAATGKKDEVNEDGEMVSQGVDYSTLVPLLVKAIQEQQAQIEELKAKIK
jgi:hypothetical protein